MSEKLKKKNFVLVCAKLLVKDKFRKGYKEKVVLVNA